MSSSIGERAVSSAMMAAAMQYAAKGWRIVVLGDSGSQLAKRPKLNDWGAKATCDEEALGELLTQHPRANIGLLLGPLSGVIDIEFDADEGRETARRIFDGIVTPTYASSRSTHRLFRWSDAFPPLAKIMHQGLEIRLGGGGKATQSVLPPSVHTTGERYYWLSGCSPEEVDLGELPREILLALTNVETYLEAAGASSASSTRAKKPWLDLAEGVDEGNRNESLTRFIGGLIGRLTDDQVMDDQELRCAFLAALGANQRYRPPLSETEVNSIFGSIVSRDRRRRAALVVQGGVTGSVTAQVDRIHEEHAAIDSEAPEGASAGQAETNGFSLRVIDGDPPEFRLSSEHFLEAGGSITLTGDQIMSFRAVRVIAMTQARVLLSKTLGKRWDEILAMLLSTAERAEPHPELHRPAVIASVILEAHDPSILTPMADLRRYGVTGINGVVTHDADHVAVSSRCLKQFLRIEGVLEQPKQREIVQLFERCGGECHSFRRRTWIVPVEALRKVAKTAE